MKTVLTMQSFNVMKNAINRTLAVKKNYSKYICLFLLLVGMSVNVWGDAIKTSDLDFGTAAVSVDFNSLSTTSVNATSSTTYSNGSMSGFTPFSHYYMGANSNGAQSIAIASSSGAMTSNHMAFTITNNGLATSFNHSFESTGAFSFKILKTSNVNIGIYASDAYATGTTYFSHAKASVFLQCTSSEIKLSAGRTSGTPQKWQSVTTDIPSTDVLEIHVIYNNSASPTTYGDDISLAANTAHVYINGNAVMDGAVPKALYINGNTLTAFRICGQTASTSAKIDDICIYDALPTKAGDAITLDKNNSDAGSTGGTGTILADATSMTIDAAPTRTGYTVEGYYTAASDGTKIAAANGDLQASVSVSSTDWTNGSGEWQNVGDKTFYTYWSPIEYLVEFNKNSASATGTMEDQEFVYGTAQNLSTCAFSRAGFSFSGWATSEDGSKVYNDEAEVNNLTSTEDDIITLYAVWTPNNYKLTVGAPSNVTIKATPEDKSDITEGNYDNAVPCDAIITLNAVVATGYTQAGWKITKDADASDVTEDYLYDEETMFMPPFDATVTATMYSDYVFSCAELTLTAKLVNASTPIFITSSYAATNRTVRSQDSILVHGTGLTPSTQVTFTAGTGFEVKSYKYDTIHTAPDGTIDRYVYIFYTPSGEETGDGIVSITGITASVGGAKPKQASLTQDIIGRHLPADIVIACKRGDKWYALPANMSELTNPGLVEIAVDDKDNPTVAYTANTNIYNLYGQRSGAGYLEEAGQYIKLGQKNNSNKPLFGAATGTSTIKGDGTATVTNDLGKQYWWLLTQTKTGDVTAATAQYSISCANNTAPLVLKENAGNPQWGFFTTGSVGPLRIIPASASSVVFAEASVVAWSKNGAIIEVNAGAVSAYSIIGKLPDDIASSKITLSQTGTSVKGTGTRYNYTVNFGVGVDFSANEGKMLTLEWYDVSNNLKAVSNVMVPRIVATNTTINSANYSTKSVWATEVHVLPGDTLFVDASGYSPNKNVTINELHIYPGATVQVLKDTLIAKNLVLRNGWNRLSGDAVYDVARLYIKSGSGNGTLKATNAYLDWYIDYDQYYPIAVPWKVATGSISYRNTSGAASAGLTIRHYDGARHANGGKEGDGNTNWKPYTWGGDMPENLVPGLGYAITARRPVGKAFSIVRMPLTIPSNAWTTLGEQGEVSSVHKDQVAVTAWVRDKGETPDHAKGWNFIANPYMSIYEGAITHSVGAEYDIEYVNIPDVNFKEFEQVATETAKLKPGGGVLIQTKETGTLTFGTANRKASAPSYMAETPKASKQKAYILLSGNEAVDQMGLIIADNYTAEYEVNADLEKLLSDGNTLRTYMIYNNLNMAYVAINDVLAQEWIPVTVRIPATGEYAFSLHSASKVEELEGLYLIDYANGDQITNLIEENYAFVAEAGTIEGRFAINAKVGEHKVPTDIDIVNVGGDLKSEAPFKFIYNDKAYIYHRGVIYDAMGKRIREINK